MEKEIIISLITTLTDFLNKVNASEIRNVTVNRTEGTVSVSIKIKKKDDTIYLDT